MASADVTTTAGDSAEPRWSLPLIQTKMTTPRAPRGRVSRHALLARLAAAKQRRLTLVIAPAGFGKTTLLSEWSDALRAERHISAWLSLDADDDDVQQFGAYVVAALRRGGNGVGRRAEELLRKDPLTPVKTVISVLLNEIGACGRHVFLVLDDFDRVASRPLRGMAALMLRYAPENFHVVLGVRTEPSLPLGTLLPQEALLRLDAADLRFSLADAQNFFAQTAEVALDRYSVELLNNAAEGWVAGLQLASLALRGADDAARVARDLASNEFGIDAYLQDAVLAQLPPPMIQFLLRTSILDRLGADVCDAVMGAGARSWEKLDWLEQHNVFTRAIDEERQWFRYHALMLDALRRRASRLLAADLPGLHRRASRWFADERLWPEAVRHALAAGDMEQAALWVENCANTLIDRGDHRTLLGWIAKLPHELANARLRLRLAKAWALALSLHTSEATSAVQAIAADIDAGRVREEAASNGDGGAEGDRYATLPAEVYAVRAVIAGLADDSPRSLELGRIAANSPLAAPAWVKRFAQSAQLYGLMCDSRFDEIRRMQATAPKPPPVPTQSSAGQTPYGDVFQLSMYGLSALMEGRLPEAVRLCETAHAYAESSVGRNSATAAVPAGYLAMLYYERNDLVAAEQMVADRTAVAMEASPCGSLLRHCLTAARLSARRGDTGSALMILEEARLIAAARQWLRLRAGCDAESVRLYLSEGRLAQAQQIVDELSGLMPEQHPSPMGSFKETWASYCMARTRVLIAAGRAVDAADLLEALHAKVSADGLQYLAARATLLRALALQRAGQRTSALFALGNALRFAQHAGMISSFIDEGDAILELLRAWQREATVNAAAEPVAGIDPQFVHQLCAAFPSESPPVPAQTAAPAAAPSELLSAREIEILEHISHGLSNKEIGRALRVAPETIKWHLKKIFEKLNVGSRIEAVQHGLGLARAPSRGADTPRVPR